MESYNLRGNSEIISWLCDETNAFIMLVLLAYLTFVLYIGPAFMKNRPPYKLRNTLLVYNGVQVVASVYLTIISLREMLTFGFIPRKCYMNVEEHWNLVAFGNHLYLIAKVSELLDTVFFVLRKKDKQITYLHLYHHSVMVFASLLFMNYPSHVCSFLRSVNSAIHVVMYGYYGLSALGPNVAKYLNKWKKYLTAMQLIQFVVVIMHSIATDYVSECPPSLAEAVFLTGNAILVFILFVNFYVQSYIIKKKTRDTTDLGYVLPTDKKQD